MPQFTLHRNYTLRSTKGRSIAFVKDEPTYVPPFMVPEVVAIGGRAVDEDVDILPDDTEETPLTPEQRAVAVREAIEKLVRRNERGDFTGSGLPDVRRLSAEVGFSVHSAERDKMWLAYQQDMSGE
jgi:hypothetical protein